MSSGFSRRFGVLFVVASAFSLVPGVAGAASVEGPLANLAPSVVEAPRGREVPELATARSNTWIDAQGKYTTKVFARPVNVREGGRWLAIDNTLVGDGKGALKARRGAEDLTLPASLSDPVRVGDGDRWLKLSMRGTKASAKIDGGVATYPDAAPGVTAKLYAYNAAIKEDLVLASADSQAAFSYDLQLSGGLRPVGRKDGRIDILDGKDEVVFSAPAPVAADGRGASAPDAAMTQSVEQQGEGWVVSLSIDRGWLKEAGRTFPVTLDPSFTVPSSSGSDCSLRSSFASASQCSSPTNTAGRLTATNLSNALISFNLAGQVPQAAFIDNARLTMTPVIVTNPGAAKTFGARDVTADWNNSATWNNRTATAAWATVGGDFSPGAEASAPYPATSSTQSKFTITNLVSRWVANPASNRGVAITDGGSSVNAAVGWGTIENADSTKWPSLEISYWPRTGQSGNYTIDSQQLTDRQSLGVNVASGNLMLTSKELQIGSTTLPLDVTRYYNSGEEWEGQVGQGGRLSIGKDVVLYECDDNGSRCLVGPSGYRVRFTKDAATGAYATPNGIGNVTLTKLTTGSQGFELKDNRSGLVMEFFNASYSWLTGIRDKNGVSRIDMAFLGSGSSLSTITDAHSRNFTATSGAGDRIASINIPSALVGGSGWQWKYGYNPYGFLTSVEDPDGKKTYYDYNAANKLSKITDPRGNDTLITYDTSMRVTSVTRKVDGTTANDVTTTYAYPPVDADCNVGTSPPTGVVGKTEVTDPLGHKAKYCWDQNGQVLVAMTVVTPTATAANPTPTPKNRPVSTKYSPAGNAEEFSSFTGTSSPYSTTAYTYGSGPGTAANPTEIKNPAGELTQIGYGTIGGGDLFADAQSTESTDPQGDKTKVTYDNATTRLNVTKIENQRGSGSPTLSATLAWDPSNKSRLKTSTDKAGHATTYTYSEAATAPTGIGGDLISVTPHNSTITGAQTYAYDKLSRVTRSKDGRAAPWVDYTYDKVGRQLTTPDSDGRTQTVTFDDNGNVLTRSVPSASQYSSYSYDKLNRKISETLGGATTTYTYDKAGNLSTLTDASGTVTYEYDEANRLKKVRSPAATGGGNDDTKYDYLDPFESPNGLNAAVVIATLPGGGKISQTVDNSGKLVLVKVTDSGGTQTYSKNFTYYTDRGDGGPTNDEGTNVTATTLQIGNTSAPTTGSGYVYELGQLKSLSNFAGSTATDHVDLTYDAAGNRTQRKNTPATGPASYTTMAYNDNNQLCWKINANVAPTCGSGSSPGATPPTGATTYTYDDAGNQTGYTGGPTSTWDAKGRLSTLGGNSTTILSPNNNEITAVGSDTYTNTALGVSRITTGGNLAKLVREPEGAAVVSQLKGTDKSWLVTDQLGSTTALISSTGAVQRTYAYDIDGNDTTAALISGAQTTNIKYAGGHDIGNGLYHFGARYYQPSIARWTQMDPLLQPGDLGQANRYLYVANNPVNAADPSGLARCPKAFAPCPRGNATVKRAIKGCIIGGIAASVGPQLLGGPTALATAGAGCATGAGAAGGGGSSGESKCYSSLYGLNEVLGNFDCTGGRSTPLA